jgi:hypothetical protein
MDDVSREMGLSKQQETSLAFWGTNIRRDGVVAALTNQSKLENNVFAPTYESKPIFSQDSEGGSN